MEASHLCEAIIFRIRREISRVYWNVNQERFYDSDESMVSPWDAPPLGIPNMEWRPWYDCDDAEEYCNNGRFTFDGVCFAWYKHLGRGLEVNTRWTAEQWECWLERALQNLRAWEYEHNRKKGPYGLGDPQAYPDPAKAVPLEEVL